MYEAHFGLAQLPFRLAPDPRFYVDAAPHRAAIAALMDELRQDEEFIPLVGEFGSGKTTIARRLLEQVHGSRHLIGELPGIRIEGDDLFDRVGEALGLDEAGDDPPVERLLRQLQDLARDGRDALLLVDDAQSLEAEALARLHALTSVRVDGRAALHVALVGRALPAGVEELRRIGQPVELGAPVRVEALDAAGTRDYILARLARAGWTGRPAFEPGTTAEIHDRCNGNPGRINRLCGHLLLTLYIEGRDDLSPEIVGAVDELLRLELEGQPATAKLPPPAAASQPAERVVPPAAKDAADAGPDVDASPLRSTATHLPAPFRARAPRAVVALKTASPARPRATSRPALTQGVVAAALLLSGGLLWQAISSFAATRAQARLARAAAVSPAQAAPASPQAPMPAASSPSARPAPDAVLALAERAIAQSPPQAGMPRQAASLPIAPAAATPAVAGIDADPGGVPRARVRHGSHARGTAMASTTHAPVTSTCTLESEALGLCTGARAQAPARPAPPAPAAAPGRDPTHDAVRPAPPAPACDPTRAALALCPAGAGGAH